MSCGLVETHGRPHTEEKLDGLEVIPRKTITYRAADFGELDLRAVLDRAPKSRWSTSWHMPRARKRKRQTLADIEELLEPAST